MFSLCSVERTEIQEPDWDSRWIPYNDVGIQSEGDLRFLTFTHDLLTLPVYARAVVRLNNGINAGYVYDMMPLGSWSEEDTYGPSYFYNDTTFTVMWNENDSCVSYQCLGI